MAPVPTLVGIVLHLGRQPTRAANGRCSPADHDSQICQGVRHRARMAQKGQQGILDDILSLGAPESMETHLSATEFDELGYR